MDADDQGHEAQAVHDGLTHALGQAPPEEDAEPAAHQDGHDVEDGADHGMPLAAPWGRVCAAGRRAAATRGAP